MWLFTRNDWNGRHLPGYLLEKENVNSVGFICVSTNVCNSSLLFLNDPFTLFTLFDINSNG